MLMKKRKRSDGEKTRASILTAATPLFAHHGRDGVGLREIAKKAGVTLPTIPYHFGAKSNLYREAATDAIKLGIDTEKLFMDNCAIDYTDKQQVADALFGIINSLGNSLSRKEFMDQTDLICQALFCHDLMLQRALLDVFDNFEDPFLEFLDKAGIKYTEEDKSFWLIFIWSQMLFYVSAREFVCVDMNMDKIPTPFYEGLAWKTAHILCLDFGLPDPNMQGRKSD